MKFFHTSSKDCPVGRASSRSVGASFCRAKAGSRGRSPHQSGFTMVEIALCLAVIGIALVAIIGVLPLGLNVQKDNREETIINQDATVFIEAIRNGTLGSDDLTNYVYLITNSWTQYQANGGGAIRRGGNSYTYTNALVAPGFFTLQSAPINNGTNIIGLLSTPEYVDNNGFPVLNLVNGGYSNHVVAYVRSISGPAVEKPPQDNDILRGDSFSYKVICDNVPVAVDTNIFTQSFDQQIYAQQLTANLHELRLTFLWPLLPNGGTGAGRQVFRTLVSGRIIFTNDTSVTPHQPLYYLQSQSFTNAP